MILFVDPTGHLRRLFLIHVHDESGSSHQCHESYNLYDKHHYIPNHRLLNLSLPGSFMFKILFKLCIVVLISYERMYNRLLKCFLVD